MHLTFRNVNEAFRGLVEGIHTGKIPTEVMASRYGEVAVVEEPVIITYEKPLERVLFNQARDANCFFHLFEALWMLAGRNDVAPIAYYSSKIEEFSDDGKTFNGSYGYRWRKAWTSRQIGSDERVDQLDLIVNHLKAKPESRRAALQMWNVEDDLLKINDSKDVCCNLSVLFSIERGGCVACNGRGYHRKTTMERTADGIIYPPEQRQAICPICKGKPHEQPCYLNMTVFNRSNDMIWGALGANIVHFSVLLEYMAARLGLEVGKYHQVTNNLHVYTNNWEPEKWLADDQVDAYVSYSKSNRVPLISDPYTFEEELPRFVEHFSKQVYGARDYREPFLHYVAQPMFLAFSYRKDPSTAKLWLEHIKADDWRIAATNWIEKRQKRRAERV